jgi:prophage regulatory protein
MSVKSAAPPVGSSPNKQNFNKPAMQRPAIACAYIGVSRSGLHRLSENDPTFPRKIVISKRCVGYRTDSLDAWLAAKEGL